MASEDSDNTLVHSEPSAPAEAPGLAQKTQTAASEDRPPVTSKSMSGPLPAPHHAITAPATVGRLDRGQSTGRMVKGRSTFIGFKPDPEDLLALRERRYMTGLFHLNSRLDILDAGHHVDAGTAEEGRAPGKDVPDPNIVVYSGPDDPLNPQNWSLVTKLYQTMLLGFATTVVTFASSIFSTATATIAEVFGVSTEVSTLSTSCFLLGYCLGPSIWGPASEFLGRRTPLLFSYLGFAIFQIPCAVAQNLQTVMLGRFCAGLFASGALAIVAGCYSDYWSAEARGGAITIYAVAAVAGPALGPVVGNFIVQSYLGWRWTAWITCFWAFLMTFIMTLTLKESFTPVLLQRKAKKLRFETKNWALRSKLDEKEFSPKEILTVYVARPMAMFFVEPILFLVTMYSSFVYAILYLLFGAVPYVFVETRGFKPGTGGLVFFAVFIGAVIAGGITMCFTPRYNRKLHTEHRIACPEERCLPMIVGGVIFPIGFFLFGWTSVEYVSSPWPQIVGVGFVGCGFLLIFLASLNLIIDTYLMMANSAVATNTIVRSGFAAGFPLFGTIMYRNLGVQWASTLLGCLALVFSIFPWVFFFTADKFIAKSKYAPKIPAGKGPGGPPPGEKKEADEKGEIPSPIEEEDEPQSPVANGDASAPATDVKKPLPEA